MEENVHRLKVQEETSKRFSLLLNICSLNSVQSMLLKKWELLRVQGGRRPAPATARRAEENDKSHSRDEHVQFFKVGFLVSVGRRSSFRQSLHQAKEKIRDLEKDNVILRCIFIILPIGSPQVIIFSA